VKFSKEAKVGIFAVLMLGALYLGFNYLKGINFFKPTNRYYAVYSDVAGLSESNPIKINGFTVGRVSGIKIIQSNNNQILVSLDISNEIVLGDSALALLDVDLLGSVSIVLQPGDLNHPLQIGDTIRSELAKGLQEILLEGALPVADNLQSTIRRINTILDNLSGSSERINSIIKSVDEITMSLNSMTYENRATLKSTLENINQLSDSLKVAAGAVKPTLDKYGELADSLKSVDLESTLAKTNEALENLNSLLVKVNDSDGTVNKLLTSDSLHTAMVTALQDLDKLLIHINEEPKHFFAPLGKSKKKIEKDRRKEARKSE